MNGHDLSAIAAMIAAAMALIAATMAAIAAHLGQMSIRASRASREEARQRCWGMVRQDCELRAAQAAVRGKDVSRP